MSGAPAESEAQGQAWRYEHPVVVMADDIDAVGHANNVVYLRWVQEAATAHWYAAVPRAVAERTTWRSKPRSKRTRESTGCGSISRSTTGS